MSKDIAISIFEDKIIPELGVKAQRGQGLERPTCIMVAGEPGAGKSTAIKQAEMGLSGPTQKCCGDDFVAYVPGYLELAKEDPNRALSYGRAADPGFAVELLNRAARMRCNVIREHAIPHSSVAVGKNWKDQGYRTELHVIATPSYQSWAGVVARADTALRNSNHIGTNVVMNRNKYDACYGGWAYAVFEAEQKKQYDRIVITRRDGIIVYDNELVRQHDGSSRWKYNMQGLDSFFLERHRKVDDKAREETIELWEKARLNSDLQKHFGSYINVKSYHERYAEYLHAPASRVDIFNLTEKYTVDDLSAWKMRIGRELHFYSEIAKNFPLSQEFNAKLRLYRDATFGIADQRLRAPTHRLAGTTQIAHFGQGPQSLQLANRKRDLGQFTQASTETGRNGLSLKRLRPSSHFHDVAEQRSARGHPPRTNQVQSAMPAAENLDASRAIKGSNQRPALEARSRAAERDF
ncbi:Zeta toxin [Rhizobium sp. NFACC06-2]|nr:Zeta toxin [Rhizobium sp. NFACC06-2]